MNDKKMNELYCTWKNGNISIIKDWIKNSKKINLLEFIQFCLEIEGHYPLTIKRMISYLE